jgi:uncharacterized protein
VKLHIESGSARYRITAYGPGRVVVNQEVVEHSLVLTPEQFLRGWGPGRVEDIQIAHVEEIARLQPELVLIGTGRGQRLIGADRLAPLHSRRIGVEVMDTGAACRTFNLLAGEGRRVAAALLMIGA